MTAYEERMLLPIKSLRSSAWEDRILSFDEQELYHMPRVVRFLVQIVEETAKWNPEPAIWKALEEAGEIQVQEIVAFLNRLIALTPRCKLDVGRMHAVSADLGLKLDMHDSIDRCVRCGIMSACTQISLRSGSAEYEINRCLYWGSPQIVV